VGIGGKCTVIRCPQESKVGLFGDTVALGWGTFLAEIFLVGTGGGGIAERSY
jgi:hypothetical protein